MTPAGLRFTKEHEWVKTEKDPGIVTIGITDFAQKQLGDIVSIEMPKIGSKVKQMQPIAIIDSVKASSDVYCAMSGEIFEVNNELSDHPELLNQSPYDLGWIIKLKIANPQEYDNLMTKDDYLKFVGTEQEGQQEGGQADRQIDGHDL